MKKSIGFFACSNGFGHYKRISEIASYLKKDFDITIYAGSFQINKFGTVGDVNTLVQQSKNIRWDEILKNSNVNYNQYIQGIDEFKDDLMRHDYVISDNIVGILKHRPDAIIIGSFFWKDVLSYQFGDNKISDLDNKLLIAHNPLIVTNKYAETGTVKSYSNKVQFGFGCNNLKYKESKIDEVLTLKPSLDYLSSYTDFFKNLNINTTDNFNKTENIALMCRPGLGIITHCIENNIPLIALYDKEDSIEIIELAQIVENLNIGFKQDVRNEFNINKFSLYKDNSIYKYNQYEKDGYKNTASYLKKML